LCVIPLIGVRRCENARKGVFSRIVFVWREGALGADPLFRRVFAARSFLCRQTHGGSGRHAPNPAVARAHCRSRRIGTLPPKELDGALKGRGRDCFAIGGAYGG
jgi:hypothetical protein